MTCNLRHATGLRHPVWRCAHLSFDGSGGSGGRRHVTFRTRILYDRTHSISEFSDRTRRRLNSRMEKLSLGLVRVLRELWVYIAECRCSVCVNLVGLFYLVGLFPMTWEHDPATHCNTLQHTFFNHMRTRSCNTLQHTATHFFQRHENAMSDRDSRIEEWPHQANPSIVRRGTAYCICNRRGTFSSNLSPSGRIRQVQNTTSCHHFCTMDLNSSRIMMVHGHAPYKYPPRNTMQKSPGTNLNPLQISWSNSTFSPTECHPLPHSVEKWPHQAKPCILRRGTAYCICKSVIQSQSTKRDQGDWDWRLRLDDTVQVPGMGWLRSVGSLKL